MLLLSAHPAPTHRLLTMWWRDVSSGWGQEKGFSGPGTRGSVSSSEDRGCWGWARLSQALVGRRLWNLQLVRNDTKCFPIRTLGQCLCSLPCSHTHALARSFPTGPKTAKDQGLHSQSMYWAPSRSLTLCPGHTDQQDMRDSWLHKAYTLVGGTSQKQTKNYPVLKVFRKKKIRLWKKEKKSNSSLETAAGGRGQQLGGWGADLGRLGFDWPIQAGKTQSSRESGRKSSRQREQHV